MYQLIFEKEGELPKIIGEYLTEKRTFAAMRAEIDKLGFPCYYTRMWKDKNDTKVDYGSHTDFFRIKNI